MQRWFLSYHSPDQVLVERLKATIERKDSTSRVFFAPMDMRAGGSWSAQLADNARCRAFHLRRRKAAERNDGTSCRGSLRPA
jgi:hypothetical protein